MRFVVVAAFLLLGCSGAVADMGMGATKEAAARGDAQAQAALANMVTARSCRERCEKAGGGNCANRCVPGNCMVRISKPRCMK